MNRRKVAINTGLSVILVAATVEGIRAIGNPEQPKQVEQTATASVTTVSSTISATGNLDAPKTVGVPFSGQPGLVTAIDVKIGQSVEAGQELAKVDDRAAQHALENANAGVASAEGQLMTAENTPTPEQIKLDRATVAASAQTLKNDKLAVRQAKDKFDLDEAIQDGLVEAAERKLAAARRDISLSRSRTLTNSTTSSVTTPPPPPPTSTTTTTNTRQAQVTASTSRSSVVAAQAGVVQAETARASTLLADKQQVETLVGKARLSAHNLSIAVATAKVNELGGKLGPIAQAEAAIDQAKVQVKNAQAAVDDTVLRAPFKGTVVDIAGDVGETPVSAARGSTAVSAVPTGPGGAEARKGATASGFVILADETHKAVTAQIDESDIGKVKSGQQARVTFPATGTVVTGTVTDIDEQETVINNVVEYNVKIALDGNAATQKLGQSASVTIITALKQNVLAVPNNAITQAGNQAIVTVRRGKDHVKVPVTVGLTGDTLTEVSSPLLKPGDTVVLPSAGGRAGRLNLNRGGGGTRGAL